MMDDDWKQKLFSSDTLLIVGGALLALVSLIDPATMISASLYTNIISLFDLRRWSVFTWLAVASTLWLIAYACYAITRWVRDDWRTEDDVVCARRLILFLALATAELWTWLYLTTTDFPRYARYQFHRLFGAGEVANVTVLISLGVVGLIVINVLLFARWLIAFLNRMAR